MKDPIAAHVVVHTKGIRGSSIIEPGEEAAVMFGAWVEINGEVFPNIGEVKVMGEADGFQSVTLTLTPSSISFVVHDSESIKA